ncbi:MAG: hypothetical protein MIO92_11430 [Methanosarcinaceae archaeon]|nr:hypothetical protein [Methanosarcinaceae archaeon]
MKRFFSALIVLVFLFSFIGCNSGGGGGNKKKPKPKPPDPCAGPVACINTDWGNQYAVFYDTKGAAYVLGADGDIFAFVGLFMNEQSETAIIGFSGPANKCRLGNFNYGLIDYNKDGTFDEELQNVTGHLTVCNETLNTINLQFDLNGLHWFVYDITAYYDGMSYLSTSGELNTEMPIGASEVDDVKLRINLLKEFFEEETE